VGINIQAATLTIKKLTPIAIIRKRIHRLKHRLWELPQLSSKAVRVKLATNAITNAPQYGPVMNVVANPADMVRIVSETGVATISLLLQHLRL
jgi:hypothetical protein